MPEGPEPHPPDHPAGPRNRGRGPVSAPASSQVAVERRPSAMIGARFVRHRPAMVSLGVLGAVVIFAFVLPLVWPHDHTIGRDIPSNLAPSWRHPFGTTRAGHDYLGQVMRGTQQTLKVGALVALMVAVIGTIWGAVAGFYRGLVDTLLMRMVDVVLIIPLLAVVLVLAGAFRDTTWLQVAVVIGAFGWTNTARVVRGEVLSLREHGFIEAARALGASDLRIIFRHLIPNTLGIVIVDATLVVGLAVLVEASLSFLGFGITPPDVSLGLLIDRAQTAVFTRPWLFYLPGGVVILIVLSVNFLGDGLRDALDPRQTVGSR